MLTSHEKNGARQNRRESGLSYRKIDPERHHRYAVSGIPGTSTVLAMLTTNSEESRHLFRYMEAILPGAAEKLLLQS